MILKNKLRALCSLLIGAFAVFAFASCSEISGNGDTGSISFSLTNEIIQAVSDARASTISSPLFNMSARADETKPDPKGDFEPVGEIGSEYYSVTIAIKGDYSDAKTLTYSMEEWEQMGRDNSSETRTVVFEEIPVGSDVYVTADFYFYALSEAESTKSIRLMTGTSDSVKITAGSNTTSLQVHGLAAYTIYMQASDGSGANLPLSNPKSVSLYALKIESPSAKIIENLTSNSISDNQYSIYNALKACKPTATYSNLDSTIVSDSYEIKKGEKVYFFSLVTASDDTVYFGYSYDPQPGAAISVTPVTIKTSRPWEYAFVYLTAINTKAPSDNQFSDAFFPAEYANKNVVAWYACDSTKSESTSSGTTKKIIAVYLFDDGNFVTTKYRVKNGETTKEVEAEGTYILNGSYSNGSLSASYGKEITQSFEIKDGTFAKEDGDNEIFYRQYIDVPAAAEPVTPEKPDNPDTPDYSTLAFFPKSDSYSSDDVVAWYASEEVKTNKTKVFAMYLFNNGNFIATKREITDDGEERTIEKSGEYKLQTPNEYQNNTGVAKMKSDDTTQEYNFTISDGLFSVIGVDTTWIFQSGSVPQATDETVVINEFDILFLFQEEKGGTEYVENSQFQPVHYTAEMELTLESIMADYMVRGMYLGYEYNEEKTDDEPVMIDGSYVVRVYFDKTDSTTSFTITTPTYSNDDISLDYKPEGSTITFTVNSGYESYTWIIDGQVVENATENSLTISEADYETDKIYSIMVVADNNSAVTDFSFKSN